MAFYVVHLACKKHQATDALSLLETGGEDTTPPDDNLQVLMTILSPAEECEEEELLYDESVLSKDRGAN